MRDKENGVNEPTRLIEDVIPIDVIGRACYDEKQGGRKGHPASLHLWWARRPLAASRAAVYSALVPADKRVRSLHEERDFFAALCKWDASANIVASARDAVLASNDGIPPRVVDLFSGGGAIPLEAARLGCEVTANELNPVAHLIEKMMLDYPQRFPGLSDDIQKWGTLWVERAWEELSDLYPPIQEDSEDSSQQAFPLGLSDEPPTGRRRPFAYLWTRTVRCPNPAREPHQVHLIRQTWLARKVPTALRPVVDRQKQTIHYEVVKASSAAELGFDPSEGTRRGNTVCHICGATVDDEHIKEEGRAKRLGVAPLAAVVLRKPEKGKNGRWKKPKGREYLPVGKYTLPDDDYCKQRLSALGVSAPDERIPDGDTRWFAPPDYGMPTYSDIFTPRQLLALMTLSVGVRRVYGAMLEGGMAEERAKAVATALAMVISKVADHCSSLCRWIAAETYEGAANTFSRQALPMVWDFAETNPFGGSSGDVRKYLNETVELIERLSGIGRSVTCIRGSAGDLPLASNSIDAVITDPPYYDNISYADLSDFFYVWLKRSLGELYPLDLGGHVTPKRNEAVVSPYRHNNQKDKARGHYESLMGQAFDEAYRILKPGAPMVCVYAHKTTMGWASLVDSLRGSGFMITEAWPIDTEMKQRAVGQDTAALATSIFLVARKRSSEAGVGMEADVLEELDSIIESRLERLQQLGITGADLVIATVGAGLRALTRYDRVEQDNGEVLPSERFLEIVQLKVLDAIFGSIGAVDSATRFYIASQYSYGYFSVPFDEMNNLARMCSADLGSTAGLMAGHNPLVNKVKGTVALRDYTDRGSDERLGLPNAETGRPAPLIDIVHGMLWRAEHKPSDMRAYLLQVQPYLQQVRQVVQALAGRALRSAGQGAKGREAGAAETLLVSWRSLVDSNAML